MSDTPREALTPCPFCGAGTTYFKENGKTWTGRGYSEPASISISVQHWCEPVEGQPSRMIERVGRDEASAIAAWNRRAALADVPAVPGTPAPVQHEGSAFTEWWDREQADPLHTMIAHNCAHAAWQARAALASPPQAPQPEASEIERDGFGPRTPLNWPEQDVDYWIRQHTEARLAEMDMRRELDAVRPLLEQVLEASKGLVEWDAARNFPVPYRVRDPIHAAINALWAHLATPQGEQQK
jgi:hypothetical protein